MLPTFETVRLILKPRTIDDLESCIEMDIAPQVTEYIPGEWNGSYEHLTFLKERILTEIGWRLKYSAWGNGYATEAAQVIIAHAFSIADFNRIVAYTHSANNRSIKMMNRLGLKYIDDLIYNGKTPSFYEIRREKYYQKE